MSPILHYFCKLFDYCMVNLSILSKFRNFLSFPDMSQVKHIIEHRVATPKQYQLPPIQNPPQAPVTYPQPYPQHIIQQVPQPVVQNLVPDQRQGMFNKGGKCRLHPYTIHVLIGCTGVFYIPIQAMSWFVVRVLITMTVNEPTNSL